MTSLKHVTVFTDGAARGNPGRGGYGALLLYTDDTGATHNRELSAGYKLTTNNRMELMGVIAALEALKQPCKVVVYTDSQYIVNAFNQHWVESWQRKGWKNSQKKPVKNDDLWKRLLLAMKPHEVEYVWLRGHAGHVENERCDELATTAADGTNLLEDTHYEGNLE